jgi:acetylornithine deacetylase
MEDCPISTITQDYAADLLCELIRCDSISPMGLPCNRGRTVERPVVELLEQLFADTGAVLTPRPVSDLHESLEIFVPGKSDGPPLFFESHMDTVPADDWIDRALVPRVEGDTVYGRGACDDKGPLTSMLLAVLDVLKDGPPPLPIILLAAGDEEFGQTGIRHYMDHHSQAYTLGVFGEPTSNIPVFQHKGVARWDIIAHGVSGHTAQPEFGRNAIYDMMKVIDAIGSYQERLDAAHNDPYISGPRITVSYINGGRTRNAVPDECTIWVDFRIIPGLVPMEERAKLIAELDKLELDITHAEPQIATPPLNTPMDAALVTKTVEIAGAVLQHDIEPTTAPYGTDASWVRPSTPSIVMGPGDIKHAHAIDENIQIAEVLAGANIFRQIMISEW